LSWKVASFCENWVEICTTVVSDMSDRPSLIDEVEDDGSKVKIKGYYFRLLARRKNWYEEKLCN